MSKVKKGDTVYFSSVARLVTEGTVESLDGSFIRVKCKVPGIEYVMASHAFLTKDELIRSKSYKSAWTHQQMVRRNHDSFGRILSMGVF